MKKKILGMTAAGLYAGVGSSILSGTAGNADAAKGVGNVAAFFPMMGTMAGAGMAFKAMKKLKK